MGKKVGVVTHYYSNIGVGTVKLSKKIEVGDTLHFIGNTTDFEQKVDQMQFEHKDVESAKSGQEIGIKVSEKVRDGDEVELV
ncbi:U32 family peptidase C-terminal domain-containing protein [Patescibacteria group bacterium]